MPELTVRSFDGRASRALLLSGSWQASRSRTGLIAIIASALAACGTVEQRPPEVRTQTVEVKIPVIVPCFTEAERPVLPTPTPINLDTATVDQMAAALAADNLADELYAKAVDALFIRCTKGTP